MRDRNRTWATPSSAEAEEREGGCDAMLEDAVIVPWAATYDMAEAEESR
jgi:hypothetical protein